MLKFRFKIFFQKKIQTWTHSLFKTDLFNWSYLRLKKIRNNEKKMVKKKNNPFDTYRKIQFILKLNRRRLLFFPRRNRENYFSSPSVFGRGKHNSESSLCARFSPSVFFLSERRPTKSRRSFFASQSMQYKEKIYKKPKIACSSRFFHRLGKKFNKWGPQSSIVARREFFPIHLGKSVRTFSPWIFSQKEIFPSITDGRSLRNLKLYATTNLLNGILLVNFPEKEKIFLVKTLAAENKIPLITQSASLLFKDSQRSNDSSTVKDPIQVFFDKVKAAAPCVCFINDLDSIGEQRNIETNKFKATPYLFSKADLDDKKEVMQGNNILISHSINDKLRYTVSPVELFRNCPFYPPSSLILFPSFLPPSSFLQGFLSKKKKTGRENWERKRALKENRSWKKKSYEKDRFFHELRKTKYFIISAIVKKKWPAIPQKESFDIYRSVFFWSQLIIGFPKIQRIRKKENSQNSNGVFTNSFQFPFWIKPGQFKKVDAFRYLSNDPISTGTRSSSERGKTSFWIFSLTPKSEGREGNFSTFYRTSTRSGQNQELTSIKKERFMKKPDFFSINFTHGVNFLIKPIKFDSNFIEIENKNARVSISASSRESMGRVPKKIIPNTSVEPRFITSSLLKFLEVLDGFYTFSSSKLSGFTIISKLLEKIILMNSIINTRVHNLASPELIDEQNYNQIISRSQQTNIFIWLEEWDVIKKFVMISDWKVQGGRIKKPLQIESLKSKRSLTKVGWFLIAIPNTLLQGKFRIGFPEGVHFTQRGTTEGRNEEKKPRGRSSLQSVPKFLFSAHSKSCSSPFQRYRKFKNWDKKKERWENKNNEFLNLLCENENNYGAYALKPYFQLLTQLKKSGITMIAASNKSEMSLDAALLRPGRFDTIIKFFPIQIKKTRDLPVNEFRPNPEVRSGKKSLRATIFDGNPHKWNFFPNYRFSFFVPRKANQEFVHPFNHISLIPKNGETLISTPFLFSNNFLLSRSINWIFSLEKRDKLDIYSFLSYENKNLQNITITKVWKKIISNFFSQRMKKLDSPSGLVTSNHSIVLLFFPSFFKALPVGKFGQIRVSPVHRKIFLSPLFFGQDDLKKYMPLFKSSNDTIPLKSYFLRLLFIARHQIKEKNGYQSLLHVPRFFRAPGKNRGEIFFPTGKPGSLKIKPNGRFSFRSFLPEWSEPQQWLRIQLSACTKTRSTYWTMEWDLLSSERGKQTKRSLLLSFVPSFIPKKKSEQNSYHSSLRFIQKNNVFDFQSFNSIKKYVDVSIFIKYKLFTKNFLEKFFWKIKLYSKSRLLFHENKMQNEYYYSKKRIYKKRTFHQKDVDETRNKFPSSSKNFEVHLFDKYKEDKLIRQNIKLKIPFAHINLKKWGRDFFSSFKNKTRTKFTIRENLKFFVPWIGRQTFARFSSSVFFLKERRPIKPKAGIYFFVPFFWEKKEWGWKPYQRSAFFQNAVLVVLPFAPAKTNNSKIKISNLEFYYFNIDFNQQNNLQFKFMYENKNFSRWGLFWSNDTIENRISGYTPHVLKRIIRLFSKQNSFINQYIKKDAKLNFNTISFEKPVLNFFSLSLKSKDKAEQKKSTNFQLKARITSLIDLKNDHDAKNERKIEKKLDQKIFFNSIFSIFFHDSNITFWINHNPFFSFYLFSVSSFFQGFPYRRTPDKAEGGIFFPFWGEERNDRRKERSKERTTEGRKERREKRGKNTSVVSPFIPKLFKNQVSDLILLEKMKKELKTIWISFPTSSCKFSHFLLLYNFSYQNFGNLINYKLGSI